MRLVQVARLLNLTTEELSGKLRQQFSDINHHTRLDRDFLYEWVKEHYPEKAPLFEPPPANPSPDSENEKSNDQPVITPEKEEDIVPHPSPDAGEIEDHDALDEMPRDNQEENTEDELNKDEPEVIKPQLQKLEGLKVVGKIEITEDLLVEKKKKKKDKALKQNDQKEKEIQKELEQINREKEREEQEYKRRKQKEAEAKKKKARLEYQKKVKPVTQQHNAPNKTKKKKQAPTQEIKIVKKHPNSVIRFWHWLNGKYD